jgi:putative redox protein
LLASALVACTAMTLRMYAARKGWELAAIEVDVRYDIADDGSTLVRTITIPADLTGEQRDRLAAVAERTPVTLALRSGTPITTTFAVRPAE